MDNLFFLATVAAVGALILSLILTEKSKSGSVFGLLMMRTGGEEMRQRENDGVGPPQSLKPAQRNGHGSKIGKVAPRGPQRRPPP
jgi:hypothetical protein